MISRRHTRLVIALLLPLMVMRAMLPAGYMAVSEQGELRVVMCSDGLLPPATDSEPATDEHPAPGSGGDCLFAHSVAVAPPAQHVVAIVDPPAELRFHSTATGNLPPATGPPRVAAARAPPVLS